MNARNVFEAMGGLDLQLIERSARPEPSGRVGGRRAFWLRRALVAACVCLVLAATVTAATVTAATVAALHRMQHGGDPSRPPIPPVTDREAPSDASAEANGSDRAEPNDSRPETPDPARPNTPPPYLEPLDYRGYADMMAALENGFAGDYDRDRIGDQYPHIPADIDRYIAALREDGVPTVFFGEDRIRLREQEGFPGISLFITESYGLPWIWYRPTVPTGENVYVQVTVIPDTVPEEVRSGSASALIRALSPGSPNVDSDTEFPSLKRVYESEITLRDRRVTAPTYEYKTDSRDLTSFLYDDLLVMVRGDTTVLDEEWFAQLSFDRCRPDAVE